MADANTKRRIVDLVTMLAEAFGRPATPITFKAYEIGLGDLDLADIERGVGRAIRECKFMPSCSELRTLCGVMPASDRAVRAWDELGSAIGSIGYYRTVAFEDAALAATVRLMGGWQTVCDLAMKPATEWETWTRKKFIETYKSVCDHGCGIEMVGPLLGYSDSTNGTSDPKNLSVCGTKLPPLKNLPAPVLRLGVTEERLCLVNRVDQ